MVLGSRDTALDVAPCGVTAGLTPGVLDPDFVSYAYAAARSGAALPGLRAPCAASVRMGLGGGESLSTSSPWTCWRTGQVRLRQDEV